MKTADLTVEDAAARVRRKQDAVRDLMRKTGKDGSRVFGRLPNDEMTREAWALGDAWRKSEAP